MKKDELSAAVSKNIQLGLRKKFTSAVLLFLAIFLPAGTLKYPQGWLLFVLYLLNFAYELLILLPRYPILFAQRSGMQKGTKKWDGVLTVLTVVVFYLTAIILAGLDFRYRWSPTFPAWAFITGAVIWILASAFVFWAMQTNPHFEATVRIQTDRDHHVIDTGPYAIVRHPGYVGALLSYIITPVILGSIWCIIPSALSLIGFILRTNLEDRTLQIELPGYKEYAQKTRFRLIPGIW